MEFLIDFLQKHPLIPLFLTLGLGFWVGKLRIRSFTLGSVAATLVVGVLVGQLQISLPDILKNTFFLFFLFSMGYSVGPQFFRSFKGAGTRLVLFCVTASLISAALVIGASILMDYSNGVASGLYAGSQTVSASLGVLSDTVREMPLAAGEREHLLAIIPACYAVTYVLGTIGSAWFLSDIGPRLMGGLTKVKSDITLIESKMDKGDTKTMQPGMIPAQRSVIFRCYCAQSDLFATPQTVEDIQNAYDSEGKRIIVERARINGVVTSVTPATLISRGDNVVLGARADVLAVLDNPPGPETTDAELLNFSAERIPVTVASDKIDGKTVAQLCALPFMECVVIGGITRQDLSIPLKRSTEIHAGDVLTLVGWSQDVAKAASEIGYADRPSNTTDMVFVGLGIAVGCIIGALSLKIDGIPLALGASVGTLIMGLALGWFRGKRPSFGHIPTSVVWLFKNLGVNMFIAILGITAGGSLMRGIHEAGALIIVVGVVLTLLSILINLFLARRLFRLSTPDTLGAVAGARCSVASIGAIENALGSNLPNLSFTVTYAVANVSLVFASLLVLFLV